MTQGNCDPERVLKKIFEVTNDIRSQYNVAPLYYSKELSFLAGEHACVMSTKKIAFGHSDFDKRQDETPQALAITENIAHIPACDDPGLSIVMSWLKKSSCYSRMLSEFTHTGIGVAESEDGSWFCTQIFATIKSKYSTKEALLLVSRYFNRYRVNHGLAPLGISFTATSRLRAELRNNPENLLQFTSASGKSLFDFCHGDAEIMKETYTTEENLLVSFLKAVRSNPNYTRMLKKPEYTQLGFISGKAKEGLWICVLVIGRANAPYRKVPRYYAAIPTACNFLSVLNDYRRSKGVSPLLLSFQWSCLAERHSQKMMEGSTEIEAHPLARRLQKKYPLSTVQVGVLVLPGSHDPLLELLLAWSSSPRTRAILLNADATHFGFGLATSTEHGNNFATRIVGKKVEPPEPGKEKPAPPPEAFAPSGDLPPLYMDISSDGGELGADKMARDVSASFRLTG